MKPTTIKKVKFAKHKIVINQATKELISTEIKPQSKKYLRKKLHVVYIDGARITTRLKPKELLEKFKTNRFQSSKLGAEILHDSINIFKDFLTIDNLPKLKRHPQTFSDNFKLSGF